ncbi:MAG: hypothetical protein AB8B95_01000 [Pseudohongiellaceae bacterium]
MSLLNAQIKWIMLVSGVFTCSMFLALFAPTSGLEMLFGQQVLEQPYTEIVVRNWGGLIGMVGALLIYGAFKTHSRNLILVIAAGSKSVFIALNLIWGLDYLSTSIAAIVLDSICVILYVLFLIGQRSAQGN